MIAPSKDTVKSKTLKQNKKINILIVEDDEASEMLIHIIIQNLGDKILLAKTGLEAIRLINENPDLELILMDIQLPEMGGYDAVRKIRETNNHLIIIAQPAYGLTGDRERALEVGCNDYISKPINAEELVQLIQKYFN